MSGFHQQTTASLGHIAPAGEAARLLATLGQLRQELVDAWVQRAVILTREEQDALRAAIRETCALLTALTERD